MNDSERAVNHLIDATRLVNSAIGGLRFIGLRRIGRTTEDVSSLAIGGRDQKPGTVRVIGNLEHNVSIAPRSEHDRLALIAWLESAECKALVKLP